MSVVCGLHRQCGIFWKVVVCRRFYYGLLIISMTFMSHVCVGFFSVNFRWAVIEFLFRALIGFMKRGDVLKGAGGLVLDC